MKSAAKQIVDQAERCSLPEEQSGEDTSGLKQIYQRYDAAIVAVIVTDRASDEHVGSAFHVGAGMFVTARHVVEGQVSCRIELDRYRLMRLAGEASNALSDEDLCAMHYEDHRPVCKKTAAVRYLEPNFLDWPP